jgi:NRPS condensation-like uncharacterized protein
MTRLRTPFSPVEELWVLRDPPDETANIQLELRVSGSLDEGNLRGAIGAAVVAHPMTRARKVARRLLTRPPLWEIGEPDLGGVLSTMRCDGESQLAAARDTFYSQCVGLVTAPALRFLLVRRPGGDSLLLNVNHAITDGIGASRFLHSVARAYGGRPDPVPTLDPLAVRDFRAQFGRAASPGSRRADVLSLPPLPRAFIAAERAADAHGYGFLHLALSGEQSRRLNPRRFVPDATVNDLMLASLHLAIARWNADQDRSCGCIALFMPANVRPPEWRYEVVANVTVGAKVASTSEQRATAPSLMEAVASQTRRLKEGRFGLEALLELPTWAFMLLPVWLPWLSLLLGDRVENTAVLSNLGRLEEVFDFGPGPGEVTEFWFSPPVGMPMGLALGVAGLHGRLHLVLRYCRVLFDDEAARRFSGLLLDSMVELGQDEA